MSDGATESTVLAGVLVDAFGRVNEVVHHVLEGLSPDELAYRADPDANSIGWLIWHLTRVQDDHLAGLWGHEQAWTAEGWYERFRLPFPARVVGYGQSSSEVAEMVVAGELLGGYQDAVHQQTVAWLSRLSPADLGEVIDRSWDPPVTAGVRLVSVIGDTLQHAGQAAFVKGIVQRRSSGGRS